ncbi:MAG: RNA polymerase-associated protein RapA [Opitutaceae bacterium]
MSACVIGQRWMSEREPELGLGVIARVDPTRLEIAFPGTGETRLYAASTTALRRVKFQVGDTLSGRDGLTLVVESVEESAGLLAYLGQGQRLGEEAVSDLTNDRAPIETLLAGQVDPGEVFNLRLRALHAQAKFRQSELRGFLGARVQLIPHQFYILQEVSSRQIARVLLADDVGQGKTIEACLILQRLLAVGKVRRALILVPEPLTHQWFVELLRRFNLWFSIYDEERCLACEQSEPDKNPFLAAQLVLSSVTFPAADPRRRAQIVAAGWDLVVIDEAHHLHWAEENVSPAYALAEELAARTLHLLLLTATPTQLGLVAHFARLRLLDPDRYTNFNEFRREVENFGPVAEIAEKIVEEKPLKPKDRETLQRLFHRDPVRLNEHLDALARSQPGARQALTRTLLDQYGTGRVVFHNTRAAMGGFPRRKFHPAPVIQNNLSQLARVTRELRAEEAGDAGSLRYSFKDDPRIDWLAEFLTKHRPAKVLLICKSLRKVAAIDQALKEKINLKTGLFHEGLPLVQRDRNAAWFAEPDGAQILLCSEIGSEGRNFQFAHHLVLFDLPLNPSLLEQRIGRLDRIGQNQTIRIHVPYLAQSSEAFLVDWYHRGLDAFEAPLQSGDEYEAAFRERVLGAAFNDAKGEREQLIEETVRFRQALTAKLKQGRDRLLELNSFDRTVAETLIDKIRVADADPALRNFLIALLDHFGVRIREHEKGDVFLDPSHAYIENFPSIPRDGMHATFSRADALVREDLQFISADHPLVRDAIDLLIASKAGTVSFGVIQSDTPNLLLEAVFVLETVADARWHVDQFLASTPVRAVVDLRGEDVTADWSASVLAGEVTDAPLEQFRGRPELSAAVLKVLLDRAEESAGKKAGVLKAAAQAKARELLSAERQRLIDLRKVNAHVRLEEIEFAGEQLARIETAINQARLRPDALRLIVQVGRAGRRI